MVTNKYGCPSQIWKKFDNFHKEAYNDFREHFYNMNVFPPEWNEKTDECLINQDVVLHNIAYLVTSLSEEYFNANQPDTGTV